MSMFRISSENGAITEVTVSIGETVGSIGNAMPEHPDIDEVLTLVDQLDELEIDHVLNVHQFTVTRLE